MKNPRSFPLRPPLLAAVLLLTAPAALAAERAVERNLDELVRCLYEGQVR